MNYKKKLSTVMKNDFWAKLFKNVITVLVGNGGSSIINFFITIIMVRTLGNNMYGIFLLAFQYMNLLDGIVNFQSWSGVIKYGSEAIVEKDNDRLYAIFKSGFLIDISTAILGTIVAITILPIITKVMVWNDQLGILAALFSVEILFHLEGTSIGILRLYDKFNLTATQQISAALIKLIALSIYMLSGKKSLIVVTAIYVATDIIKHLILVVMAMTVLHKKGSIHKVFSAKLSKTNKSFFKYTIWNNISYTVDVPVRYFDIFIISAISVEMVAIYKVFKQIIQILSMIVTPISMAILPQFSELAAQKKAGDGLKKVLKLRNAILGIGLIAILGASAVCRPVFNILFGTEYGNNTLLFIVLLAIQVLLTSYIAIHPFFASLGKAKQDFCITLTSNLVYMAIAFLMVNTFGIYAVAIATLVQGTLCIIMKFAYSKRYIVLEETLSI